MRFAPAPLAALALVAAGAGCKAAPEDGSPEGAARAFVERLEASATSPRAVDDAYALLSARTHAALEARAERSSRAQGRRFRPAEMIAEGWLGLEFRPTSFRASVQGAEADVTARGADPSREAHVKCVREAAGWRVELELPP